jgi:hypothetical protein
MMNTYTSSDRWRTSVPTSIWVDCGWIGDWAARSRGGAICTVLRGGTVAAVERGGAHVAALPGGTAQAATILAVIAHLTVPATTTVVAHAAAAATVVALHREGRVWSTRGTLNLDSQWKNFSNDRVTVKRWKYGPHTDDSINDGRRAGTSISRGQTSGNRLRGGILAFANLGSLIITKDSQTCVSWIDVKNTLVYHVYIS